MARTLRDHLIAVAVAARAPKYGAREVADAILADPVMATIFGKAAHTDIGVDDDVWCEASALLDDWLVKR